MGTRGEPSRKALQGAPTQTQNTKTQKRKTRVLFTYNKNKSEIILPRQARDEEKGQLNKRVACFWLNQKANLVGRPPVPTEAYLNRHNAVLDSSELTLSKLVAKVLRLEKLGKLALSSLNAVRAEQADKDETDRHMEVGEERDAQVKNILRSLEKFEAVCSMIHTATSAKACEPLVKQVRNKKKRRRKEETQHPRLNYQLLINYQPSTAR